MSRLLAAFGESALLLPASLALILYLAATGRKRLGLAFGATIVVAAGATLALKIAFHACGHEFPGANVMSPSGHASLSVAFYGSLAAMFGAGRPERTRRGLAIGATILVLLIGASRVRTWAHTIPEVIVGLLIGLVALALFLRLQARLGRPTIPWIPPAIGFATALLLLGGLHLAVENSIGRIARNMAASFELCTERKEADHDWRRLGLRLGPKDKPQI